MVDISVEIEICQKIQITSAEIIVTVVSLLAGFKYMKMTYLGTPSDYALL